MHQFPANFQLMQRIDVNGFKNEILTCESTSQLNDIQSKFQSLINSIFDQPEQLTSFNKKLENEKIQYIQNLLRSKLNFLTRSTFKFVGDPIPPNSNINIKNVSPLVDESTTSKIDKDSLIFINETKVLNVDYCHISTLSNSIIKVNGKSINLNNAYNSFGFIFSSGPLFLQNMEKCILIAGCHQARLHNITDSIIIFENNEKDTQKTVIIENCRNVKFNSVYVDDFDHPTKFTESPNYQILQDDVVSEIENEIEKVELNDLTGFLKRFLSTSN